MKKGCSGLLIDEAVLPDSGVTRSDAFPDLSMMALETGAERTSEQYRSGLREGAL